MPTPTPAAGVRGEISTPVPKSPLDPPRTRSEFLVPTGTEIKVDVRIRTILSNVQVGFQTPFRTDDPVELRKAPVCTLEPDQYQENGMTRTQVVTRCVEGLTLTGITVDGRTYAVDTDAVLSSKTLYSETAVFHVFKPLTVVR